MIGDGIIVNFLGTITATLMEVVNMHPYWSLIESDIVGFGGVPVNTWLIGLVTPVVGGMSPNIQLYEIIPVVKLLL